jgi:hypothetical protein
LFGNRRIKCLPHPKPGGECKAGAFFFIPLQCQGHCYCLPLCVLHHPQIAAKPICSTCDCFLLVVSGGGNSTTMDVCNAILPWYADIVDVRSNNDGDRTPTFDGGNIDGGVADFDNGMLHATWGQQQRRGEGSNTGGGSGGSGRKRRHRGTSWGEQPLACFILAH